jgi:hypothetical protein
MWAPITLLSKLPDIALRRRDLGQVSPQVLSSDLITTPGKRDLPGVDPKSMGRPEGTRSP